MDPLQIQALLEELLGSDEVHLQPPSGHKMSYPAIKYNLDLWETDKADNKPYRHKKRYQITIMDTNPRSLIPAKVAALPMSTFDRFYPAEGLNHFVFNVYF